MPAGYGMQYLFYVNDRTKTASACRLLTANKTVCYLAPEQWKYYKNANYKAYSIVSYESTLSSGWFSICHSLYLQQIVYM